MGIISPTQAPVGPAGGSLAGTYPNPELAAKSVTSPKLAEELIVTKGLGMYGKAPPAAQPGNPVAGAFAKAGTAGCETAAEFKLLIETVEKMAKIIKELGQSA